MGRRSMPGFRLVVATLLLGSLSVAGSGAANAQEDVCLAQLRDVPLETLELPSGYRWESLEWADVITRWYGSVEMESADESDGVGGSTVALWCSSDAAADMARQRVIRSFLGEETRIGVAMIGDESVAFRVDDSDTYNEGNVTIEWRHGSIIGSVEDWREPEAQDFGMLEQLAKDIDALLP
jgi:hypothetical protein